jgi:hypothetical protein
MANETRRIILKKGVGVPTVPASNDHTDGTWLSTDIYKNEFYQNTSTGYIYTRNDSGIVRLQDELVNTVNIKSVNGQSLVGSGDITISAPFIPYLLSTEINRGYRFTVNSTAVISENTVAGTTTGTATAQTPAITNTQTQQLALKYGVSTPAANGVCAYRSTQAYAMISNGFRFVVGFGVSDTAYNSGARQFYGVTASTTNLGISSTVTVEQQVSIIGIGSDAADTNLQIFHNDGTGTATKIDLGANFPANRTSGAASTDFFTLELFNEESSSNVLYKATSLATNTVVQGTLTTNLPTSTMLSFQAIRTSGASSNACSFNLSQLSLNTL